MIPLNLLGRRGKVLGIVDASAGDFPMVSVKTKESANRVTGRISHLQLQRSCCCRSVETDSELVSSVVKEDTETVLNGIVLVGGRATEERRPDRTLACRGTWIGDSTENPCTKLRHDITLSRRNTMDE